MTPTKLLPSIEKRCIHVHVHVRPFLLKKKLQCQTFFIPCAFLTNYNSLMIACWFLVNFAWLFHFSCHRERYPILVSYSAHWSSRLLTKNCWSQKSPWKHIDCVLICHLFSLLQHDSNEVVVSAVKEKKIEKKSNRFTSGWNWGKYN